MKGFRTIFKACRAYYLQEKPPKSCGLEGFFFISFLLSFREHGDLDALLGGYQLLGNALYLLGCHLLNHLAVVKVEVGIVVQLVPDDVAPVVVGDGGLLVLLDEVLLDFLHGRLDGALLGDIEQLLVDDGVQLLVAVSIRRTNCV